MKTYKEAIDESFNKWYEQSKPFKEQIIRSGSDEIMVNATRLAWFMAYEAGWYEALNLINK